MKIAVCLITSFSPVAFSQGISLTLVSGAVQPGSTVSWPLYISNAANATNGVQWNFWYSPSDFTSVNFSIGGAADSAAKILTCNSPTPGQSSCVIWGLNVNALSDGILTSVNLIASNTVSNNPSVSITDSIATSYDASMIPASVTPPISGLSCSPPGVVTPGSSSCTATLSGVAPDGGVTILLGYTTGPGVSVTLPASVTVPPGAASGSFTVQVDSGGTNTTVQLTGTQNGSSATFSLPVSAM